MFLRFLGYSDPMSMSTWVIGFVPPDDEWKKMADVWFACKAAGVEVPHAVEMFFDEGEPDPHGQEIQLPHRDWSAEMRNGIEIDVAKIPPKVKIIRFYNSY